MADLPKLKWVAESGVLATALGVTRERAHVFEVLVQRVVNEGGGIRHILDTLQDEMPDATFEEWTVAVFAVGHFDGGRR